jgi:hypothetical protein
MNAAKFSMFFQTKFHRSTFVMQNEPLLNRYLAFAKSMVIGFCCAWGSTFHLTQAQSFWRPPIVFFVSFFVLFYWFGRRDFFAVVWMILVLPLVYWAALFLGMIHTGWSTIGAVGTMWLIRRALNLDKAKYLRLGVAALFAYGLFADIMMLVMTEWKPPLPEYFNAPVGSETGIWNQCFISGWQVIAFVFRGLQLGMHEKYVASELNATSNDCAS